MKIARVRVDGLVSTAKVDGDRVHLTTGSVFAPGEETGVSHALSGVTFLPPTDPTKIVAIGVNYRDHAGTRPAPVEPQPFLKSPSSLIGADQPILLPADAQNAHMEAEVVAVIGKRGRDLAEDQVDAHVLGYTAGNDVSERDWQQADLQWWRAKSSDTFTTAGPWIDTSLRPESIEVVGLINGREQQASNTDMLIHSIRACIARISRYMTLEEGDLVYTGTPGTTGRIQAGDVCEVRVGGIVLRNTVADR
ncbi:MAG: fumarylacetoacetate hydrolase family protein [Dehalococcoidia bacterium]|nr:fumarylacetoacetate hydrolase family protein [Dehalococcoidia bacterium]